MITTLGASTSFAWRSFCRSPNTLALIVVSLILNLVSWWLPYWQLELGDNFLTIRYSIYVGANWVAPWYYIFLPPLTGLLILIVNIILGYLVGRYSITMRFTFLWLAVMANLALAWLIFLLVVFNS
ncbi:MAG: hypothetical protein ABIJ81_01625 [Patescibacteria group bacterium]